jgi:hypothetical protein
MVSAKLRVVRIPPLIGLSLTKNFGIDRLPLACNENGSHHIAALRQVPLEVLRRPL